MSWRNHAHSCEGLKPRSLSAVPAPRVRRGAQGIGSIPTGMMMFLLRMRLTLRQALREGESDAVQRGRDDPQSTSGTVCVLGSG